MAHYLLYKDSETGVPAEVAGKNGAIAVTQVNPSTPIVFADIVPGIYDGEYATTIASAAAISSTSVNGRSSIFASIATAYAFALQWTAGDLKVRYVTTSGVDGPARTYYGDVTGGFYSCDNRAITDLYIETTEAATVVIEIMGDG